MTYKNWKLMDKITVAVRTKPNYNGFTGYVVEAGDEKAVESAKDWAEDYDWDREKQEKSKIYEPSVYTFDNKDFSVRIIDSAGGSSQGGRLSFWSAEVEKDGVKFTIGVNDAILADLIRNSHIINGVVQEKVMFARKGGQPGLIHEGMDSYKDAVADMKHKSEMKSAKKTSKWEIGGVYSSITKTDVCLGEVWDTMEEVQEETGDSWYNRRTKTVLRKRKAPKKVYIWTYVSTYKHENGLPKTFEEFLKEEMKDRTYVYFDTGKPPARAKTDQLEVKESDMKLLDELIALKRDGGYYYGEKEIKGRYLRTIKEK